MQTSTIRGGSWLGRVLLCLSVGFASRPAAAQTAAADAESSSATEIKKNCASHYEQAQVSRNAGKLLESMESLLVCSQQACPAAVRGDCVQWYQEVKQSVPSVVVTAHSADRDEVNVRVLVDGKLISSRLEGKPLQLNPGSHQFRFESDHFQTVEKPILLVPGEKRQVEVVFSVPQQKPQSRSPEQSAAPRSAANTETEVDAEAAAKPSSPVPTLTYVAGAIALVSAANFAAFGLWGIDQRSSLQDSCRPSCRSEQVDSVKTKFIIADVSLGLAVASAATAVVVYFTRSEPSSPERHGRGQAPRRLRATSPQHPARANFALSPLGGALFGIGGEF